MSSFVSVYRNSNLYPLIHLSTVNTAHLRNIDVTEHKYSNDLLDIDASCSGLKNIVPFYSVELFILTIYIFLLF